MNKEEFLKNKGYIETVKEGIYFKVFDPSFTYEIVLKKGQEFFQICFAGAIHTQKDIDNLQTHFNILKSEFEECIKLEN